MDCRRSSCLAGGGNCREAQAWLSEAEELQFVPAVVDAAPSGACRPPAAQSAATSGLSPVSGMIEVEIDGVTVRVGRGADAKTIAAVLRALKASA